MGSLITLPVHFTPNDLINAIRHELFVANIKLIELLDGKYNAVIIIKCIRQSEKNVIKETFQALVDLLNERFEEIKHMRLYDRIPNRQERRHTYTLRYHHHQDCSKWVLLGARWMASQQERRGYKQKRRYHHHNHDA